MSWSEAEPTPSIPHSSIPILLAEPLLPSNGRFPTTQHTLLNLASRRFGQLFNEVEGFRHFEVRHMLAGKGTQIIFGHLLAALEDDKRMGRFTPLSIGQPDHRDFLY